jgi:uncharacterized protein involved in exopolysaccharide biosynthesis
MADIDTQAEEDAEGKGGISLEVVKSYVAFAKRAWATHKLMIGLIIVVGLALTGVTLRFFPRTFRCTTALMTVANPVLDGERYPNAFAGVNNLIMRRENLEQIVRETDLVRKNRERRPTVLRLKDRVVELLTGKLKDEYMVAVMVATLETRLGIETKADSLVLSVDWSDGPTAADLVEAATQSFLKVRHSQEISAFSDKMAILDQHATRLREEIAEVAKQVEPAIDPKALMPAKGPVANNPLGKLPALRALPRAKPSLAAASPETKAKLVELKQKLQTVEGERNSRMANERAKLEELKLKFTASHPQVVLQEERVALASQVPSELALLRSEVTDLEGQLRQRDALAATERGGVVGAARASGQAEEALDAEPLPPEIMRLLSNEQADPAKTAQLSGAVTRYGHLRDDMRGVKLALDVAQAAFNHRYQVLVPVEVPTKPAKPNLIVIVAAGIVLSLLFAFALPVLMELRRGVIVEYWQVHQFELPVLGELRLPAPRE